MPNGNSRTHQELMNSYQCCWEFHNDLGFAKALGFLEENNPELYNTLMRYWNALQFRESQMNGARIKFEDTMKHYNKTHNQMLRFLAASRFDPLGKD